MKGASLTPFSLIRDYLAAASCDTGASAERPGTPAAAGRGSITTKRRPPSITCALVTINPSGVRITPDPVFRWVPSSALLPVIPSVTGPYAVTRTCTTADETLRLRSAGCGSVLPDRPDEHQSGPALCSPAAG